MKKAILVLVCLFALSLVAPAVSNAEVRSETKKQQDEAYKKGKERSSGYKKGKSGKPSDDGYKDMDDTQREAYKKGYRDGQK